MATLIGKLFSKRINKEAEKKAALIATNITDSFNQRVEQLQSQFDQQNNFYNLIQNYTSTYKTRQETNKYASSAHVYSIVRLIAKTAAKIPLYVYEVKDDAAYKAYKEWIPDEKGYTAQYMKTYKELHQKALQLIGNNDPLQMLLDNPNDQEEKQEFYTGVYGFKLLTGNTFINFPIIPLGKNQGKVQGMYTMPAQNMVIVSVGTFPRIIIGYTLNLNELRNFDKNDILHLKYWNPIWDGTGSELVGMSPLKPLWKELEVDDAGSTNELSQFKHGGPPVVMANESMDPTQESIALISQIKKNWEKEKEGPENAGKWSLTPGKVNVHVVGQSPVDLNILNRKKVTVATVCNAYSISDVLLNNDVASTESNVIEMQKALYTNAVLPEVYSLRDGLNRKLVPKFQDGKRKIIIDCDITGIPQLQPNFKAMADTFAAMPIMRPNDIMEAFKYGRDVDPLMDKIWIKSGYQLIEDAAMSVDPVVQPDANDPNKF